ncbi:MAG: hypothetical protein WKG07_16500 [Hymenobacter sp.]
MADNTPVNGAAPKPAGQTYFGEAIPGFAPAAHPDEVAGRHGRLARRGFRLPQRRQLALSGLVATRRSTGTALAPSRKAALANTCCIAAASRQAPLGGLAAHLPHRCAQPASLPAGYRQRPATRWPPASRSSTTSCRRSATCCA